MERRGWETEPWENSMAGQSLCVLVLADLFVLPYKVLFCLRDAGVREVYVLANSKGSRLRYSRFSRRVFLTDTPFDDSDVDRSLSEINDYVHRLAIDVVIPGDQNSTRLLSLGQSRVATRGFPVPDAARFEVLYNKWNFFQLCQQHDVLCPDTV